MDTFDFDTPIDRRTTSSTKWNRYNDRDVIPMWVADMDFRCAPPIVKALRARVDHGVFGYTDPPQALAPALVDALRHEFALSHGLDHQLVRTNCVASRKDSFAAGHA